MGMADEVIVGEVPFRWTTQFPFPWMGGWVDNQKEKTYERDLLVVIPGRDRSRAIVMGDHYDTAYMEDVFGYAHGGKGPRLAAAGADDNHSATATLMLGAESFLRLSKAGKLECDIWLVHLTGEEFPADCMGARHLCQRVVEGNLAVRTADGKSHDLSKTRVAGVYVLDMVAHNNDRDRDVFQMCPGTQRQSMWLARQAHEATETWNASVPHWNATPERKNLGRGQRSADGTLPAAAAHLRLEGEIRPPLDPRSTLYNTDGQIFSDAGVPVVLFMENYDINRKGYHDTHDTLENIDLDYGSAVAAIAIESVARAASQKAPN
jgi:Zn-dependent M28 family amino/carboxypeptidase